MKTAYAITPFSALDYPGQMSCIVWFPKCNLRCVYCHNPDIVDGSGVVEDQAYVSFLKSRVGKLTAVVFSGGEPTLCPSLVSFAAQAKEFGFKIKVDTNGASPNVIQDMINRRILDFVALDYKCPPTKTLSVIGTDKFVAKHEETLDLLIQAKKQGALAFEVRTTYPPDYMDEDDLNWMIARLDDKGYDGVYYIQAIASIGDKTLGKIEKSVKLLDRSKLIQPKNFTLSFRNFAEEKAK